MALPNIIAANPFAGDFVPTRQLTGTASLSLVVAGDIMVTARNATGTVSIGVTASGTITSPPGPLSVTGSARVSVAVSGVMATPNKMTGTARIPIVASGILSPSNPLAGVARIGVTAAGTISSAATFAGTAKIEIAASGAMGSRIALSGTVRIPLTAQGALTIPVKVSGTVGISLAVSGTISPYQAIADAVAGAVTAWVVNTATGGHSTYSNFTFNSFFRLGNDYYGCSDAGFIKLDGTADITTAIPWAAKTGITTFGVPNLKYVHDARITMRTNDEIALRQIVDEQIDVSNNVAVSDDRNGIHARRVKLPKGVKGTAWQFEISGTSTQADIKALEVDPILSKRTER